MIYYHSSRNMRHVESGVIPGRDVAPTFPVPDTGVHMVTPSLCG